MGIKCFGRFALAVSVALGMVDGVAAQDVTLPVLPIPEVSIEAVGRCRLFIDHDGQQVQTFDTRKNCTLLLVSDVRAAIYPSPLVPSEVLLTQEIWSAESNRPRVRNYLVTLGEVGSERVRVKLPKNTQSTFSLSYASLNEPVFPLGESDLTKPVGEVSCTPGSTADEVTSALDDIRSCTTDADCGQVLTGTSCGCTRDLVARVDADVTTFNAAFDAAAEEGICSDLSTCDCPDADGFRCQEGLCNWNYTN